MAPRSNAQPEDFDAQLATCLAKAVCDGDMVNLRFLFHPASPYRATSPEHPDDPKYSYLLPGEDQEDNTEFEACLALARESDIWRWVKEQLTLERPAQLPGQLVLRLADNAVRRSKYTMAAQAYELLRIRERMRDLFFEEADRALGDGDIQVAVRGYIVATGLGYDYAAFPEPEPQVTDFQTRALVLHAEYPDQPEDALALWDREPFARAALGYLLLDAASAARLDERPIAEREAFIADLIERRDPHWSDFVARYLEACVKVQEFGERLRQRTDDPATDGLAAEIARELGEDPRTITACLLGRDLGDVEWWQYLKELAYKHPAAVLFVARQMVGDHELLVPRLRADSELARQLGLLAAPALQDQ